MIKIGLNRALFVKVCLRYLRDSWIIDWSFGLGSVALCFTFQYILVLKSHQGRSLRAIIGFSYGDWPGHQRYLAWLYLDWDLVTTCLQFFWPLLGSYGPNQLLPRSDFSFLPKRNETPILLIFWVGFHRQRWRSCVWDGGLDPSPVICSSVLSASSLSNHMSDPHSQEIYSTQETPVTDNELRPFVINSSESCFIWQQLHRHQRL